jgi:hypothetical protein
MSYVNGMRLVGWNSLPEGYAATFDMAAAPAWLRFWMRTPFIDRFAYPVMVRRGFGWLHRDPALPKANFEPADGWRIAPWGRVPPEGRADLEERD